jgi:hypothetical protein
LIVVLKRNLGLFLFTGSSEQGEETLSVDHASVVNDGVDGIEGLCDFLLRELVTPGDEGVLQSVGKENETSIKT